MIDYLNMDILYEAVEFMAIGIISGAGVSCIATALSYAVSAGMKILHKMF